LVQEIDIVFGSRYDQDSSVFEINLMLLEQIMDSNQSAVPLWHRFEQTFSSTADYPNPVQDVQFSVRYTSPSGDITILPGFWDGGATWRIRFSPDETGLWRYSTTCSNPNDSGLQDQNGSFECTLPSGNTRFERHGPVKLSENRRYLAHADGTPFFWLADTCWNGPLRSTDEEWEQYLSVRAAQKFTAVQWVATQWIAAPQGDIEGQRAFEGHTRIEINPHFFQRLDRKLEAINQAGLLGAPVMLWAANWGNSGVMAVNPGLTLPEDQAVLLAGYMAARWDAFNVVWLMAGDGDYRGEHAGRWQHIGRQVFGNRRHAPVALHPAGLQWNLEEFRSEDWLDIAGYQSSHSSGRRTLSWLVNGPPASDWKRSPARPFINLEPNYEGHNDFSTRQPFIDHPVRRAAYWSLLNAPTAGVSYGGHGVWGWDDGTTHPVAHPTSGIPLPWQQALHMPGAQHMAVLADLFAEIDWHLLEPLPDLLLIRPGTLFPQYTITNAVSPRGDLAVFYLPENEQVEIRLDRLMEGVKGRWYNPRSGDWTPAEHEGSKRRAIFFPPGARDWLLVLQK
jgi:hypothetical protein